MSLRRRILLAPQRPRRCVLCCIKASSAQANHPSQHGMLLQSSAVCITLWRGQYTLRHGRLSYFCKPNENTKPFFLGFEEVATRSVTVGLPIMTNPITKTAVHIRLCMSLKTLSHGRKFNYCKPNNKAQQFIFIKDCASVATIS